MSRSSFPWILRHQPQEELLGIPSFLSRIILTFQRCFLPARFKNRLASLASAWAVKASREIFTKYFPGFVWFCYQVIHSLAKRLIQIRDVTQRVKFINVFLCNKDLFYYKSHISLLFLSRQWDPPHLSFGFPNWKAAAWGVYSFAEKCQRINITTAAAVGSCQHNIRKRPIQILRYVTTHSMPNLMALE